MCNCMASLPPHLQRRQQLGQLVRRRRGGPQHQRRRLSLENDVEPDGQLRVWSVGLTCSAVSSLGSLSARAEGEPSTSVGARYRRNAMPASAKTPRTSATFCRMRTGASRFATMVCDASTSRFTSTSLPSASAAASQDARYLPSADATGEITCSPALCCASRHCLGLHTSRAASRRVARSASAPCPDSHDAEGRGLTAPGSTRHGGGGWRPPLAGPWRVAPSAFLLCSQCAVFT